jgi:hypothetical protein
MMLSFRKRFALKYLIQISLLRLTIDTMEQKSDYADLGRGKLGRNN